MRALACAVKEAPQETWALRPVRGGVAARRRAGTQLRKSAVQLSRFRQHLRQANDLVVGLERHAVFARGQFAV